MGPDIGSRCDLRQMMLLWEEHRERTELVLGSKRKKKRTPGRTRRESQKPKTMCSKE